MPTNPAMTQDYFQTISRKLYEDLKPNQFLILNLLAEETDFSRWNDSRLRQTGMVADSFLSLQLLEKTTTGMKRADLIHSLSGQMAVDSDQLKRALGQLSLEVSSLPADPYLQQPKNFGTSQQIVTGKLLPESQSIDQLGKLLKSAPLTGIYSSGKMIRANSNSLGQSHWFQTDLAHFDFSLINTDAEGKSRAIKIDWASQNWSDAEVQGEVDQAKKKMSVLLMPKKKVSPGAYRTYLAPAAVSEFYPLISGIFGESMIQKGGSPARHLREGRKLNSKISIIEDLGAGKIPKFNSDGEVGQNQIQLVENGQMKSSLVSSASAVEFSTPSNAASDSEQIRSLRMLGGNLKEEDAVMRLQEGLFLSNLHYLNWSDLNEGRITGMTRYACFWVENGQIQSPIEDLRWDDSLFHFFGDQVEELTQDTKFLPTNSTYEYRQLGGCQVPGILLKSLQFVL